MWDVYTIVCQNFRPTGVIFEGSFHHNSITCKYSYSSFRQDLWCRVMTPCSLHTKYCTHNRISLQSSNIISHPTSSSPSSTKYLSIYNAYKSIINLDQINPVGFIESTRSFIQSMQSKAISPSAQCPQSLVILCNLGPSSIFQDTSTTFGFLH